MPKEQFDYLSVVGSLLHIANCVRCDVAYAVGVLARHAAHPGQAHVRAAKRVLMYLYRTRDLGITFSRDVPKSKKKLVMFERGEHPLNNGLNYLQVFSDSDYAADETRRSTSGVVIMLNGGPIAWTSTLGKTVATSTCEAEVNAAVMASKEAIHFQRLLLTWVWLKKLDLSRSKRTTLLASPKRRLGYIMYETQNTIKSNFDSCSSLWLTSKSNLNIVRLMNN